MTATSPIQNRLRNYLFDWTREVSIKPLVVYRVLFGLLMLFSTIRFLLKGWVYDFYIAPEFHFSYFGFEWIPYPSPVILYFIFAMMILACIGITLGFYYRFSAVLFFILFTYVELLDKTTYLNHYYFVSLVAFLLIFLPANRYFSLDVFFARVPLEKTIPNRSIAILKFQIAVVYIFAGLAKVQPDWLLEAQPLRYWLHTTHHWPLFGDVLKSDGVAYFFSWFGCIYDLLIVFFLLNHRTRNSAYFVVIIFHVTTWLLFPIGVFPWVMIAATTIFLSDHFHSTVLSFFQKMFRGKAPQQATYYVRPHFSKIARTFLIAFIIFQLVFPLRFLAYPGDLFWTEQGFRFSWRVMLMEKTGYSEFFLADPVTGIEWPIKNTDHLTPQQEKMMNTQPDMILQYAQYLEEVYSDTTLYLGDHAFPFKSPEVHAEIYVTLNGRPSRLYVDKSLNLGAIENNLAHRSWLEEFKE